MPGIKPGYASRSELSYPTIAAATRQVVAGIGVLQSPAGGIEDGIQAGDEHARR